MLLKLKKFKINQFNNKFKTRKKLDKPQRKKKKNNNSKKSKNY